MPDAQQAARFAEGTGFIAALDQSGGSTPRALREYGVDPGQYANETEMFDLIHDARRRIVTSPVFTGSRILAAILFQDTMVREIDGRSVADYLWSVKQVIPFLKIDRGLLQTQEDVQLMRDIPDLGETLAAAAGHGIFGTKQRSVIHAANPAGIERVVDQQFAVAERVLDAGLLPILEPEVDIAAPDRQDTEGLLKAALLERLAGLGEQKLALKLTIPVIDGFYADLIEHPRVSRVVALSGGFGRDDANARLARNPGLIASFSRALLEGLHAQQTTAEFDSTLDASIESIYQASTT